MRKPPFPWLFRLKPYYPIPTEGEKELVQKLEERAVAFKEPHPLGQTSAGDDEGLLGDLEAAGIFNSAYSEKKEYWLQVWECPTLLTYHKDAMRFRPHGLTVRQALPRALTSPHHRRRAP